MASLFELEEFVAPHKAVTSHYADGKSAAGCVRGLASSASELLRRKRGFSGVYIQNYKCEARLKSWAMQSDLVIDPN